VATSKRRRRGDLTQATRDEIGQRVDVFEAALRLGLEQDEWTALPQSIKDLIELTLSRSTSLAGAVVGMVDRKAEEGKAGAEAANAHADALDGRVDDLDARLAALEARQVGDG
jgi:hypothetical protein